MDDDATSGHLDAAAQAALQWQVVLWSGEVTPEERRAFEQWLGDDPAHRQAWQRVQRVAEQLHAVPSSIAAPALRSARAAAGSRNRRRAVLRSLALLAGAGIAAYAVRETPQWQFATADYRTARGERRELVLPDGTQITLNTATAVDLRFTAQERRLVLLSGEVLVATAPDNQPLQRPFLVETGEGTIRPLGTRFTVRRLEETSPVQSLVQVLEGTVEIAPRDGDAPLRLRAGQKAVFSRSLVEASAPVDPIDTAWLRGLLVAERMRLADFITELGRYRSGVLRCDPSVADLVISGVYPLDDSDAILQSVAQALPVRIRATTRYWVTVMAR